MICILAPIDASLARLGRRGRHRLTVARDAHWFCSGSVSDLLFCMLVGVVGGGTLLQWRVLAVIIAWVVRITAWMAQLARLRSLLPIARRFKVRKLSWWFVASGVGMVTRTRLIVILVVSTVLLLMSVVVIRPWVTKLFVKHAKGGRLTAITSGRTGSLCASGGTCRGTNNHDVALMIAFVLSLCL
jgi:hypothetical protein